MQESIFDIFGTQVKPQQPTIIPSSSSNFQALKGADNVTFKTSSVSDLMSSKKALGDVGNRIKSFPDTQESRKLLLTNHDQENSFIKPSAKTPLPNKKPVTPNKQTPDLKSTVRTPLSDLKAASVSKELLQNPSKSTILKNGQKNSLLSEISAFEDFINGDGGDLSWMQPDDVHGYEPIDDYEDIIPISLRPSEEDIHRMVHFWEMHTKPLEFEFGPMLPLVEELGKGFGQTLIPDIDLCEDLHPVPVPPVD